MDVTKELQTKLGALTLTKDEEAIAAKVQAGERITPEEGLKLYESDNLPFLGMLADHIRKKKHGLTTYFNRNFHIEPTNICIYECAFCSFARKPGQTGGWEYSLDEIDEICRGYVGKPITEVHIVGGVHPKRGVEYYGEMMQRIKKILPHVHIKGFTAVELKVMFARSRMSIEEGLQKLREFGLDSLPGGGAEIFHPDVRKEICHTKASTSGWLEIHEAAHKLGIPSNCTILYGHLEKYEHRIDHMMQLRDLQDRTGGFNTYIPLKFLHEGNEMEHIGETTIIEDLKNYAVSRIFLDNIPHLKAYWPMIGRDTAQLSLSFGVNDVDGTIDDTTKIYSMAGAEDQNPALSTVDLVHLINKAGYRPVERDTVYNVVRDYTEEPITEEELQSA